MMKFSFGLLGLTVTSALALATLSANAADVYVPGPGGYKDGPVCCAPTWAGFYAGVNGGYGWNADDHNITLTNPPVTATTKGLQPEGGFGGGQIGYNWQSANFVLGIETDIQGSDMSDSLFRQIDAGRDFLGARTSLDYFGTVRGRLGYAFGNVLVYGTGGFAYGGVNTHLRVTNPGSAAFADVNRNETETGYAAGGGVEYAMNRAWSFKVEYQYIDLGSNKFSIPITGGPGAITSNNIDHNFNTVRAGFNYHIPNEYVPLK